MNKELALPLQKSGGLKPCILRTSVTREVLRCTVQELNQNKGTVMKWEMGHEITDELTLMREVGAGPIWQV